MPYVIFSVDDQEIDRREFESPVVIGRASNCQIAIRDIMMSRMHARLERRGEQWVFVDLQSRNGSFIDEQRIEQAVLRDGDTLRLGRTTMRYCAGAFEPGPSDAPRPARPRPADPNESFAGTVVGFELLEPGEAQYGEGMPVPQPKPLEPAAYAREGVRELLQEIASSSWKREFGGADIPVCLGPKARLSAAPPPDRQECLPHQIQTITRRSRSRKNGHTQIRCRTRVEFASTQQSRMGTAVLSLTIGLVMTVAFLVARPPLPDAASAAPAPEVTLKLAEDAPLTGGASMASARLAPAPSARGESIQENRPNAPKAIAPADLPRNPKLIIRALLSSWLW